MSITASTYSPNNYFSTADPQAIQEHRYVWLDVYIQPQSTHRVVELGWIPVTRVATLRHPELLNASNGIVLVDNRPEYSYLVESKHVQLALKNLCCTLGLQPSTLGVAAAQEPAQTVGLQREISLGSLLNITDATLPCRLSQTDGSMRCQVRVFALNNDVNFASDNSTIIPSNNLLPSAVTNAAPVPSHDFHSTHEVVSILRPTLLDQQNITRQRIKGITDRSRICKELRNAVPSHLKKRKNRRAVIKTLQDLEAYMGSIDPVFEECGSTAELCITAARTIGLSNTRFVELRRMWEAYRSEMQAENHEILELSPQKDACTLRKLVAILERYGWSCTSAQPRSNEDITRPPRLPISTDSPNWIGSLRKRSSCSALSQLDSDDYESDFSPKRPRSECCSSEEGNTSDEGELHSVPEPLITNVFDTQYTTNECFLEENFFHPSWTPRDSSSSDAPNIMFDLPDVDLFNEVEKQILAEFL